jgi:hypothetical protein
MILTKFRPVTVLKNQVHVNTAQSRKAWLRKTLTVTQFVIAQFLVIATLVVSKQINFSLNKELGTKKMLSFISVQSGISFQTNLITGGLHYMRR